MPLSPIARPRSHLYIDVTATGRQPGPVPGHIGPIGRNLAARLLERHPERVRFCAYDDAGDRFVDVPCATEPLDGDGTAVRPPADDARRRGRAERWIFRPARRLVLPLLHVVPGELAAPLAEVLSRSRLILSALLGVAVAIAAIWRPARRESGPPATTFAAGDALIFLDADADRPARFACADRLRRGSGLRTIVYCLDATTLDHPEFAPPGQRAQVDQAFADMVRCADQLICASEATRAALKRFIASAGLRERPVGVIEPGATLASGTPAVRPPGLAALRTGGFALCVAAFGPGCNHQLLYDLWVRLIEEMPDAVVPLLVVGEVGWFGADLIGTIRDDRRLQGRLLVLGGLPDDDVAWLYRNCAFTLHPTLAEGWAQAVAESLAVGKYCVASTAAANAELGHGLLDLLDPLDFMAWRNEVGRLLVDPDYRAAKERRIAGCRPPDRAGALDRLSLEIDACPAAGDGPAHSTDARTGDWRYLPAPTDDDRIPPPV